MNAITKDALALLETYLDELEPELEAAKGFDNKGFTAQRYGWVLENILQIKKNAKMTRCFLRHYDRGVREEDILERLSKEIGIPIDMIHVRSTAFVAYGDELRWEVRIFEPLPSSSGIDLSARLGTLKERAASLQEEREKLLGDDVRKWSRSKAEREKSLMDRVRVVRAAIHFLENGVEDTKNPI